jgi:hypothetical protein
VILIFTLRLVKFLAVVFITGYLAGYVDFHRYSPLYVILLFLVGKHCYLILVRSFIFL